MKFRLFQTTVAEYKRFQQQLPIDYSTAIANSSSDSVYVAIITRLILLRKYIKKEHGNQYLDDILNEAITQFPEHQAYLTAFKLRFHYACDQSLSHILSDGTIQSLDDTVVDTMYGLHLHADPKRIHRIMYDDELLRSYCVSVFVKEIEALVLELFSFFDSLGIKQIEKEPRQQAPTIHLDKQKADKQNITGSPFWKNLIGYDITEETLEASFASLNKQLSSDEKQLWLTATAFLSLLSTEFFSISEMKRLVFEPNFSDWGDFSEAIKYYKSIPSPGITTRIRYYNSQRTVAYLHVHPHVETGFIIDGSQLVTDIHVITLVKDSKIGEWRVFAFGTPVIPTEKHMVL